MSTNLKELLRINAGEFAGVLPFDLTIENTCMLDLSVNNEDLNQYDLSSIAEMQTYIERTMSRKKATVGYGGYMEDRLLYRRSQHFGSGAHARTIHLGIDLWTDANTSVHAPLDGFVHSFQVNDNYADYGPTIILEHQIENTPFYTLYGHLTSNSMNHIKLGMPIKKGQVFAHIGESNENGGWPPHLHFQIIADMMGKRGDFYGVCNKQEQINFERICPDPNIILHLPHSN